MFSSKYSIKKIRAREVLDSRGNPTVEVDVITKAGLSRAIVPSGASTGTYEALELRDRDKRFHGKGVLKAVENINRIIAPKLKGDDCIMQHEIDEALIELDGTQNKSNLGANASLAVSMAVCKAGAQHLRVPLFEYIGGLADKKRPSIMPVPMLNIINGGRHAGIENDIQEHMIMPTGAKNFHESLRMGAEVYHELKNLLKEKYGARGTLLGDEGGFAPKIHAVEKRLDIINCAIKNSGYQDEISIALDSASTEFFSKGHYQIGKKKYSSGELIDFYSDLVEGYKIVSIEDGMAEDDWDGWKEMTRKLGNKIQIVGDDLLVTNPTRIKRAVFSKACNALLLKVNQIGTVTEAINAAHIAQRHNWNIVVSHRSGETEDPFIADLVVGLNAGQSKFGAPARSERNAKYNQLLRIEEMLSQRSIYYSFKHKC